jgi:heme exporter protein D
MPPSTGRRESGDGTPQRSGHPGLLSPFASLEPRRVVRILLVLAGIITLLHVVTQFSLYYLGHERLFGFRHVFDLDYEKSLGTWFQSTLLAACAALLVLIGRATRARGLPHARRWTVLAGVFVFISVDEATEIHEVAIEPVNELFSETFGLGSYFGFLWLVAAIPVVVFVAIVVWRLLRSVDRSTRRWLIGSAFLYLMGVVTFEILGLAYASAEGTQFIPGYGLIFITLEESSEAAGVIGFVYSLLRYLGSLTPQLDITLARPAGGADSTNRPPQPAARDGGAASP